MAKILALCETPYQIIVVSKIIREFYLNEKVDLIITNHICNAEDLIEKIKKNDWFSNVYYLETKSKKNKTKIDEMISYIKKYVKVKTLLKNANYKEKKYDTFLFCNMDIVCQHIIQFIKKESSINIKMFEDGLSSYTNIYGDFFNKIINAQSLKDKIFYNFFRANYKLVQGMYVFNPEYIKWKTYFQAIKIPKINKSDKIFINKLNEMFSYTESKDEYKTKYIFFEESYYVDGVKVNDLGLVKKISEIVGKENLTIKIHPRNTKNRFKEREYKTNKIISIPWEILALNMNLEDKIFITIASGSVMNPFMITGINIKAIMLFNYKDIRGSLLGELIDTIENICEKNPKNYSIVKNEKDLQMKLNELLV